MDDDMAEAVAEVFVCFEVDLDYEFDAPKFFDLSREETAEEAREAELWFNTAGSYPPSPLIAKLIFGKDVQVASASTVSNIKDLEYKIPHADSAAPEFSIVSDIGAGCTFNSSMLQGVSKVDNKPTLRNPSSKRSTLMKPTASQLAKQNRTHEVNSIRRFRKQLDARKEQKSEANDFAHQAPKRQRLESGHCCKMQVTGIKPQIDLFHKIPEKQQVDTKKSRFADVNNQLPRLRLTIPREPELKTAKRAVNLRAQQQRMDDARSLVGVAQTTSTFKALPLNRKILEGPSLPIPQKSTPRLPKFKEFNFRTHDRAQLHSTAASSVNTDRRIPKTIDDAKNTVQFLHESSSHHQMQDEGKRIAEVKYVPTKFKAQALNQKILDSKGDFGVFRSTKREITKPKEFNFSTTKRFQQTPLTELFNKLCLTSEAQKANTLPKFPFPHLDIKDSKENLIHSVQQ
ncbi:protein TPX2-like [Canna indica]|uniref:Protein TPX2-like n=1 Tax=Canna indica TaxID=4628 RepID=A0AAQ3KWQ6_9LILI|nr:protein TPX2-like [Canna indica]